MTPTPIPVMIIVGTRKIGHLGWKWPLELLFKFCFCYNILDRESEYLFAIFDSNNDGNIDIAEELNIRYKTLKSDYISFKDYFASSGTIN